MKRYLIILLVVISAASVPKIARAFTLNPLDAFTLVTKIREVINGSINIGPPSVTFPFGGRITESGTACKLKYKVKVFGVVPIPGIPIPLFGTKVKVSQPGIPASDIFTFPGITRIYANNHQDRVGAWTLGIATRANYIQPFITRLNTILGSIPDIPLVYVTVGDFGIGCPNGGLILQIGTS